jgi:hypothetical protein
MVTADTSTPVLSQGGESVSEWTTCTVSSNKLGTFSVNATTEESNPNGTYYGVSIASISRAATQASPAVGLVSYLGPTSGEELFSGSCNFYFKDGASTEGVADREIWCAYTCPSLTVGDGGASGGSCEVTESYIAYRNCAVGLLL